MLKLALAALILGAASAGVSAPSPPFCHVVPLAVPDATPGFYTVTLALRDDCPQTATADVRLESYIGGSYLKRGWFHITRTAPLIRPGVPWYWRAARRLKSGKPYPFVIPGMRAPFGIKRP